MTLHFDCRVSAGFVGDVSAITTSGELVIGSEADGLGSFWLAACDDVARIPMASGMDSLNAAAASAVLLWELLGSRESE